jgi:transposase
MEGMLVVGFSLGMRSKRRLCDVVHLNLAWRWLCRFGLDGVAPDHSTFRHGRFRDSNLRRRLFELVLGRCIGASLFLPAKA